MAILVINSYDKLLDLNEIAPEKVSQMVVLTTPKLKNNHKFQYYEEIPDISENELVEYRVEELTDYYEFDSLIAHDEYDMIRAGRIRDRLGIPGQTEKSGRSFRDKVVMKECAEPNVRTPVFRKIDSIFDVYDFRDEHGYPFILKPIDQGASRDIFVVRSEKDIQKYAKTKKLYAYEAETFIEGDMYHVDALFINNNEKLLSVSQYWNGCLAYKENASLGSFQISSKSAEYKEVKDFFYQLLKSFECPENVVYHAEVFREAGTGELILCEIASRIGGGYILQALESTYGVNIKTEWIRSQCGLDMQKELIPENMLHGFLLIPPYKGKIIEIPEQIPFQWVNLYDRAEVGTNFKQPHRSIDNVAGLLIEGENEKVLQSRLNQIDAWLRSQMVWQMEVEN